MKPSRGANYVSTESKPSTTKYYTTRTSFKGLQLQAVLSAAEHLLNKSHKAMQCELQV